jgi:glycosyltransferase involved in cell wall biosynthesis
MKVSVLVPTYNQSHYISQCLDGILAQQLDFPIEILVGEDDSDDGTREIVRKYGEQYPDKVKVFLNDRKSSIAANGQASGSANFVNLLHQASGQYIAICEGDDYWFDPLKLKRQVEFMDGNPGYTACFHDVSIVRQNGEEDCTYSKSRDCKEDFDVILDDLILENPILTVSVLFLNSTYIQDLPEWFFQFRFGDWPLFLINAMHGPIRYMHFCMAAYRLHNSSAWSTQDYQYRYSAITDFRFFLNRFFEGKYEAILKDQIVKEVSRSISDCNHYKSVADRTISDCNHYKSVANRAISDCNHYKSVANRSISDCNHYKSVADRAISDCNHYKDAFDRAIADYEILHTQYVKMESDFNKIKGGC